MNTYFFLRLFALLVGSGSVSAEQVDTAKYIRDVCKSKSMSNSYKSRYDEAWASAQKHFEEQVRKGVFSKQIVESPRNVYYAQFGILEVQYQSVIIYAFCFKKTTGKHIVAKNFDTTFDACIDEQSEFYQQMLRFTHTYGHLDNHGLNITVCKAKCEMLDVESNCPPYDWMLEVSGTNRPKAYDAKAFL